MAPNSCSDSATDELHDLGQVLPSKPHFSHLLKDQLDSKIAVAPFSLNPLGFQVSVCYPGEIGSSYSQHRDSEKVPTVPSSAIINKGVLKL